MREITSKSIDGITDLVVVAPIKADFIKSYEHVTYATRLKVVAEALNRIRVTAREYERLIPFSDVTERIMNILDFRIGVLDNDLFEIAPAGSEEALNPYGTATQQFAEQRLVGRRYLYLAATFEGGWEPYMRMIWNPLGAFLDLIFCNCDGYVSATEHSCDEYLQWVRDHQVDSAIFYSTTGLTTRDQRYLSRLERLGREGAPPADLAAYTVPHPDPEAYGVRARNRVKTIELGLEALNVLYKLADFYPPDWLTGTQGGFACLGEGHRLIRATDQILKGFRPYIPLLPAPVRAAYQLPLEWFETGLAEVARLDAIRQANRPKDPKPAQSNVQGGILKPQGSKENPIRHGALMMFTIRKAAAARAFIKRLPIHYAAGSGATPADGMFYSIAFTAQGLERIGLPDDIAHCFPKEFREGMAARSGLLGDQRENHPRNWILPERWNSDDQAAARPLPPVEPDEIDFIIQLRTSRDADGPDVLASLVRQLERQAAAGASLEAIERLHNDTDPATGMLRDYFGYQDGFSQPKLPRDDNQHDAHSLVRDRIARGEVLLGYANDRTDAAPSAYATLEGPKRQKAWRAVPRAAARKLMRDGSFLVIRKIEQDATAFSNWIDTSAVNIGTQLGIPPADAAALLRAKIMGRDADGRPLAGQQPQSDYNDFDYAADQRGLQCPHAAHIRRANPRRIAPALPPRNPPYTPAEMLAHTAIEAELGRPTPRLLRRGMLFNNPETGAKGLMFMAYSASIAEQYEVIQRWLNGGNSTDIAAADNDPITGVRPRDGGGVFRFAVDGAASRAGSGEQLVNVPLPAAAAGPTGLGIDAAEPGRHPFTPLHWGLYLFVPSRKALASLCALKTDSRPLGEMLEDSIGKVWIERLTALDATERGKEWKRLLEDFVTKDPAERDITPHMWAAIRWYYGGAMNMDASLPVKPFRDVANPAHYDWADPKIDEQNVIVVAGRDQALQVLSEWQNFSSEEQLRRITDMSSPIYVAQQPDNGYRNPALARLRLNYASESVKTNEALMGYGEKEAFDTGYLAGKQVLDRLKAERGKAFKLELRREYLQEAIGVLFQQWYGLPDPDQTIMEQGGWTWKRIVDALADGPPSADPSSRTKSRCPGDFMASSRATFYPRPSEVMVQFGSMHGKAIIGAAKKLVKRHRPTGGPPGLPLARSLFAAVADDNVLARNIAGTMVGAIPPMEGNLRGIVVDWLIEKTLWRHQSALHRAARGQSVEGKFAIANRVLRKAVEQAICKRPSPDLLYRTVTRDARIDVSERAGFPLRQDIICQEGDLVVVSLASVSQWSLAKKTPNPDVSIVFGGKRKSPAQGYVVNGETIEPAAHDGGKPAPPHACPAQKMAMGAMIGIMAALLDAGRIQAMPAALIVRISDW